jgi:hypothetical protein
MAIALGYPVETPVSQAEKALEALSKELANNVYLLSGLRGEVYPGISAGQEASWVGRKGEHLLFILSRIASPYYVGVRDNVQKWALEFRMADVWAGYSGGTAISGFYSDPDLEVTLNLASASQGSRQVLGMIAQLFWAKPGSIVMIEEPELSLHPGAQDKLPALFADAIKDGKQVMITTHSHYLLLALTEAVKAGLPAKDIAVYEVRKEPETGTTAKRLEVSNKGHIRGWVSSFAEVDKQLLDRRMGKSGRRASSRTDA